MQALLIDPVGPSPSDHVVAVIRTLDALVQDAGEQRLTEVQKTLEQAKQHLVQWVAQSELYQPVQRALLQMVHEKELH